MHHSFTRKNEMMNNDDILDLDLLDVDDKKEVYEEEVKIEKKKRVKRKKRNRLVFIYFTMLLLIIAVSFDVMYIYINKQQEEKIAKLENEKNELIELMNSDYLTKEQANDLVAKASEGKFSEGREDLRNEILAMFDNGDGVLKILENVYFDKIVVPDSSGYYFFDVDEKLAKHGLDFDKFIYPELDEETGDYIGEVNYEDDNFTVKRGIDVSKFQGDINWNKVKADNVDFAILRCGYRGYETGKIVEDETFEENIKKCNAVGMDVGCYFFTEAKTEAEGREEADFVIDLLKEYEVDVQLPIIIDVEQSANPAKSRTKNLTPEDRTKIVIAFCERVKEAGYEPMIYGNLKSHMRMTDIYQLEEYPKWFAYYRTPLRFPYKFDIWQFTSTGSVDGIKGDVDINLMFVKE